MFSSAWLAAVVFAVCGSLGFAAGEIRGSSAVSQAQRLFGDDAVAALERRLALQAPASKHAKQGFAGTDGDAVLPSLVQHFHLAAESIDIGIGALAIFERRPFTTAQPRAPPRSIER